MATYHLYQYESRFQAKTDVLRLVRAGLLLQTEVMVMDTGTVYVRTVSRGRQWMLGEPVADDGSLLGRQGAVEYYAGIGLPRFQPGTGQHTRPAVRR